MCCFYSTAANLNSFISIHIVCPLSFSSLCQLSIYCTSVDTTYPNNAFPTLLNHLFFLCPLLMASPLNLHNQMSLLCTPTHFSLECLKSDHPTLTRDRFIYLTYQLNILWAKYSIWKLNTKWGNGWRNIFGCFIVSPPLSLLNVFY